MDSGTQSVFSNKKSMKNINFYQKMRKPREKQRVKLFTMINTMMILKKSIQIEWQKIM